MENRLIKGTIEDINQQLDELRKDYFVKIGQMTSVVKLEIKRIIHTVSLELKEK